MNLEPLPGIVEGLSAARSQRYLVLQKRREAELLTPDEQMELIAICDELEAVNVSRLEKFSALARLQRVTLKEIMDQSPRQK